MLESSIVKVAGAAVVTSFFSFFAIRQQKSPSVRLLLAIPVVVFYLALPVLVYDYRTATIPSALLGCIFSWLASFKLLMLVFARGPLADPAVSDNIFRFSAILCSPINPKPSVGTQNLRSVQQETESSSKFLAQSALKVAILLVTVQIVDNKERLHTLVYHFFCYVNLYLFASLIMDLFAATVSWILGIELLPDFDRPFLSQSLAEFWARRWNLTVSGVLRGAVYEPLLELMSGRSRLEAPPTKQLGFDLKQQLCQPPSTREQLGPIQDMSQDNRLSRSSKTYTKLIVRVLPVLATFFVSGIMHELALWYLSHTVTGEMTAFFTLHGVATIVERWVRTAFPLTAKLPRLLAIGLTLTFCFLSADWLFLPPLYRAGVDNRVIVEMKRGLFLDKILA